MLPEAMLNQPRHVVYHSHNPSIFDSHGSDHAERPHVFVGANPIGSGDQRAISHGSGRMLSSDYNMYVTQITMRILGDAFIYNLNHTSLLFNIPKQTSLPPATAKVSLFQYISTSIT